LIVAFPLKGKDNNHYHIWVYFDGLLVYEKRNFSPRKDHTKMAQEAARRVLQKWRELNPEANGQEPNPQKNQTHEKESKQSRLLSPLLVPLFWTKNSVWQLVNWRLR